MEKLYNIAEKFYNAIRVLCVILYLVFPVIASIYFGLNGIRFGISIFLHITGNIVWIIGMCDYRYAMGWSEVELHQFVRPFYLRFTGRIMVLANYIFLFLMLGSQGLCIIAPDILFYWVALSSLWMFFSPESLLFLFTMLIC